VTSKYRSGLEERIASFLKVCKEKFSYEPKGLWVRYIKPHAKYKPDFILSNGIIIEAKGLFRASDRNKHLLISKQHPNLDVRFVFSNSKNKLSKKSKTTYGMWCARHGFLYSDQTIPKSWLYERPSKKKLQAIKDCYEQ
tara:strand:+ start:2980 stop:3396 length:417 start_codon:yes stop_codon:yes gene_type:complete